MSDDITEPDTGPLMLWATDALKAPRAKLYQIPGTKVNLARPVSIVSAVAFLVGMLVPGLFPIGLISLRLGGITGLIIGMALSGVSLAGLILYNPKGNGSLLKLAGRWIDYRSGVVTLDGQKVQLYVGTKRIKKIEYGEYDILPGSIEIPVGTVDRYGLPLKEGTPTTVPGMDGFLETPRRKE